MKAVFLKKQEIMQFRPYQQEIIEKGTEVITRYSFLYLAMEVRTGKTLTSFGIANNLKVNRILFVTKRKLLAPLKKITSYIIQSLNWWL